MIKQRGITFLGFIGVLFLLAVAFYAGTFVQVEADINELDSLLAETCDTETNKTGFFLTSSDKYYRCEFVRDMTPEERLARVQRIDEATGRKSSRTKDDQAGITTLQPGPEGADPVETREK